MTAVSSGRNNDAEAHVQTAGRKVLSETPQHVVDASEPRTYTDIVSGGDLRFLQMQQLYDDLTGVAQDLGGHVLRIITIRGRLVTCRVHEALKVSRSQRGRDLGTPMRNYICSGVPVPIFC